MVFPVEPLTVIHDRHIVPSGALVRFCIRVWMRAQGLAFATCERAPHKHIPCLALIRSRYQYEQANLTTHSRGRPTSHELFRATGCIIEVPRDVRRLNAACCQASPARAAWEARRWIAAKVSPAIQRCPCRPGNQNIRRNANCTARAGKALIACPNRGSSRLFE